MPLFCFSFSYLCFWSLRARSRRAFNTFCCQSLSPPFPYGAACASIRHHRSLPPPFHQLSCFFFLLFVYFFVESEYSLPTGRRWPTHVTQQQRCQAHYHQLNEARPPPLPFSFFSFATFLSLRGATLFTIFFLLFACFLPAFGFCSLCACCALPPPLTFPRCLQAIIFILLYLS